MLQQNAIQKTVCRYLGKRPNVLADVHYAKGRWEM